MSAWREFDAAVHVLEDPLIWERCEPFVKRSLTGHPMGIEFEALLDGPFPMFGYSEQRLVLAALDLWNARATEIDPQFGLRMLVGTLSQEHVRRIVVGMAILGNYAYDLRALHDWHEAFSGLYREASGL